MRISRVTVATAYFTTLAGASLYLADASWKSVTSYRSGYALDRTFDAGPALTGRVVLVILDGLRVDRSKQLPVFGSLARTGASGTFEVVVPSLSNPARAAIVTGTLPEVSGVTNNSMFSPPPVQSLFGRAAQYGIESAVHGTRFWPKAFGDQISSYRQPLTRPVSYEPVDLIDWQTRTCGEALRFLESSHAGLQVLGLLAGDDAGHTHGGESNAYRDVTATVDECLGRIADSAGPDSTIVAVSDHGHIHRWGNGGHGGEEPEVLHAPFAMAGPGIRAGGQVQARLVDITPTLSILLGIPIPANSQGAVLWDLLDFPADHAPALRDLERTQREALLAHMPNREESLAVLRQGRIPAAVVGLAWFLALVAASLYQQRVTPFAIALVVFVAMYYALFHIFQLGYSISAIVRQEFLYSFFGRNIAAAAVGLLAASECLRRLGCFRADAVVRLTTLITSGFGLMVTTTYYRHGLWMEGWMIEIGPGFKAYLDMLAIFGVVLGTALFMIAGRLRTEPQAGPS